MAIWDFSFVLVPRQSLIEVYHEVPTHLSEYAPRDPRADFDENAQYPEYWSLSDVEKVSDEIVRMCGLKAVHSWSDQARMFSGKGGVKLEAWPQGIEVSFDARVIELDCLRLICDVAKSAGCVMVLHEDGRVVSSDYPVLQAEFERSRSKRFLEYPEETIKKDAR